MSSSHKGSRLLLSGNIVPVDFSTEYHDFNNDATGIQYGNLVQPSGNPIYTIRFNEGSFGGGVAVEEGTTNLWSGAMNIYNNYNSNGQMTASLVALNETYMGQTVYRLTMTPVSANAVTSVQNDQWSHGIYGSRITYQSGNTYMSSIYWRPINKTDISVGGTASNISGWSDVKTYKCNDDWNRSISKWNWTGNATDNKYWSFWCPSAVANQSIIIDWVCPQIELNNFATSYTNGTRAKGALAYYDTGINHTQGTFAFWYEPTMNWNDKTTSNGSNEGTHEDLFTWGIPGQSNCLWSRVERENSVINVWYGSSTCQYSVTHLSGNQLVHIAFTWQNNSQVLYINGKQVSSTTVGSISRPTTGFYEIGTRQAGSSYPTMNGVLSDFIITPIVMSAEDINAIYISNRPLYNPYDYRATAY